MTECCAGEMHRELDVWLQSVAKSAETSASDARDDDDDDDEDEDDAKLQSSGFDPDRLKAFNVCLYFICSFMKNLRVFSTFGVRTRTHSLFKPFSLFLLMSAAMRCTSATLF